MKKEVQLDERGYRKYGMRDSLAYAAGDFGCNMSFALKGTMALFWTQFMQMDSILYATLLIVVQIWDAINDPLIGSIIDADQRKYKRNKFMSYIFFGSIGLIVGGALVFIPWPSAPKAAKIIIFVSGYVIWDAFYTIANVPYGSLLSLISQEPADRASLSAWRSVGSLLGNMLPMALLPFLIYDSSNNIVGERVFLVALLMGVMGFVAFQFMIRNTEVRVEEAARINNNVKTRFNVVKAMSNFLHNRPAVGATVAAVGMFIGMQGAMTAVQVLFQSYFKNVQIFGVIQIFSMLPIILFTPLARKMVVKFGKKELSVAGSIFSIVAGLALLILPITPDGTGLVVYVLCMLIFSLGLGIYSTVSWALMGDAIDYNEWKNGVREEGVTYSLHSFFRKLAQGVGPALTLVIMVGLGYVEADRGNQSFDVALNMRYLVAWLYFASAILQFVGLGLIYNLDKKRLAKMNEELEERRRQSA